LYKNRFSTKDNERHEKTYNNDKQSITNLNQNNSVNRIRTSYRRPVLKSSEQSIRNILETNSIEKKQQSYEQKQQAFEKRQQSFEKRQHGFEHKHLS
jgi:hypothetical protein